MPASNNTFLTDDIIVKEAAFQAVNNMVMGNLVHRDFKKEFVKKGDTVSYRKPAKFIVNDGADITNKIQSITDTTDTITINKRKNVAFQIPSDDLTLSIEDLSERYIKPASISLANQIDADGLALADEVYNCTGVAGTTPTAYMDIASAGQKLTELAIPNSDRRLVVNPAAEYAIPDGLKGLLQPTLVKNIINEASVGRVAKFDIYGDQNVATHTGGNWDGANITVQANAVEGASTMTLTGFQGTGQALKKGDVFTVAGVYAVNPVSKQSTGALQPFVLTADVASTVINQAVSVSPAMIADTTDANQNISALPQATNAVEVLTDSVPGNPATGGTTSISNLAFAKNALSLVSVPIVVPESAKGSSITYNNVSIRYVKDYDAVFDEQIYRLDVMYGWKLVYPEMACRVLG